MRGKYRQTFLRVSVDGEETAQSANFLKSEFLFRGAYNGVQRRSCRCYTLYLGVLHQGVGSDQSANLKAEMKRTLPDVMEGALFSMVASLNQDESCSTAVQKSS
jgi:hypothetical protein